MKSLKKLLSISLAALLVVGTAATAQAKDYNIGDGYISVYAGEDGKTVYVEDAQGNYVIHEDASPVITGTSDKNQIAVSVDGEQTARLTLDNVTVRTAADPSLFMLPLSGKIELILKGSNDLIGLPESAWGGVIILPFSADTADVTIGGKGTLNISVGEKIEAPALVVDNTNLSMEEGKLTVTSPDGCGIGLYGGSTLSVSEDYLHPASVTVKGGEGSFDMDDDSQVLIGDNNFVFDEKGRDITAQVLANPDLLKTLKYVIISTRDIAVFPSGNMESNVHMMTAYKNTKFEQTGEPSAEAMKILSEGMQGEALYAGSFAFTDEIQDHGKFQVNIMLPQYAGKHVTLVTLDGGKAVAYDRWVGNDGLVWAHVNHLGDFAVFAA